MDICEVFNFWPLIETTKASLDQFIAALRNPLNDHVPVKAIYATIVLKMKKKEKDISNSLKELYYSYLDFTDPVALMSIMR